MTLRRLELLKVWCETTAETIFPKRKIGHLKDGYEASFLVLHAGPIADFANTQKIEMRVKQGEILSLQNGILRRILGYRRRRPRRRGQGRRRVLHPPADARSAFS
jgi:hypothetical protein